MESEKETGGVSKDRIAATPRFGCSLLTTSVSVRRRVDDKHHSPIVLLLRRSLDLLADVRGRAL